MTVYCPACDRPFDNMTQLLDHINRGKREGDEIHIDIAQLEGWEETSDGKIVKTAEDLEET